jgi:PBP1b-binding outer membrane lipoprotein LpoB
MKIKSTIVVLVIFLIVLITGCIDSIQPTEPTPTPTKVTKIPHLTLTDIKWSPPYVSNDLIKAQDDYR